MAPQRGSDCDLSEGLSTGWGNLRGSGTALDSYGEFFRIKAKLWSFAEGCKTRKTQSYEW